MSANLAQLPQPVCIVLKSDALSIAAATALAGALTATDARWAVHTISHYTAAAADEVLHDDYPAFLILECNTPVFKEKLAAKNAFFLDAAQAYDAAAAHAPEARSSAMLLVAGAVARHHEQACALDVPDRPLEDALQQHQLLFPRSEPLIEITEDFILSLQSNDRLLPRKVTELAQLLTATARTGKASLAIAALLGDAAARESSFRTWAAFRNDLAEAIRWYEQNKHECSMAGHGYVIVQLGEYPAPSIAAPLAAHLAHSQSLEDYTFILVTVHTSTGRVRFSLRTAGHRKDINLAELLRAITQKLDADVGGNPYAAGGTVAKDDEQRFIDSARNVLGQVFAEEHI